MLPITLRIIFNGMINASLHITPPPILWATSTNVSRQSQGPCPKFMGLGEVYNQNPVKATFILQTPRLSHRADCDPGPQGQSFVQGGSYLGVGEAKRSHGIIKYCTWSFYSVQQK